MTSPGEDADLEPIYSCPSELIPDEDLRALYSHVVRRLHMELMSVGAEDMSTFMLVDRTAFYLVLCKQKERQVDGYRGNQQVTLNKLWLEFTREFYAQKNAAKGSRTMTEMMDKVKTIIFDTVSSVQDPKLQRSLAEDFSNAFERERI